MLMHQPSLGAACPKQIVQNRLHLVVDVKNLVYVCKMSYVSPTVDYNHFNKVNNGIFSRKFKQLYMEILQCYVKITLASF